MEQQFAPPSPRGQQRMQNIRIAVRIRRTWLASVVIPIFIIGTLFIINIFFPAISSILHISFSAALLLGLIAFLIIFLCMLLTAKRQAISAYRKAVRRSLEKRMKSYHPPKDAPQLSEDQGQHLLLLGLPGGGKTKTLENFLYQTVSDRALQRIPVLIEMKYYNGFFRQLLSSSPTDTSTAMPMERLLAYLLDNKHKQSSRAKEEKEEPELVGIHHLQPYLAQLFMQGRIVFLCDGLNELERDALPIVHQELIDIMQTGNRVIMTCRELEYREEERLQFDKYGAVRKTLSALAEEDVPRIAQRYLQSQATREKGRAKKAALSRIEPTMERIGRINRPHQYTSPFMLIMLIQALKKLNETEDQTISRGRLLQISVSQRLTGQEAQAVRRFLSVVACTARRNGQRNAIQLANNRSPISRPRFAELLNEWLQENGADDDNYTVSQIKKFLGIAQITGLITISNYGTLSFMHELIAEYFAAEYLFSMYHEGSTTVAFWANLYESEANAPGIWSEPIALWAGLEGEPMDVATFLIQWAEYLNPQRDEYAQIYYHAVALSLTCLGVRPPAHFPDEIWHHLKKFVPGTAERAKLAKILQRCADEGGSEVYKALLPLIAEAGVADLFLELNKLHSKSDDSTIPDLLLGYLQHKGIYNEDQVQKLVAVLGELGRGRFSDRVREGAHSLSEASRETPLREAAIGMLGHIKNPQDVQLLISYLHDSDRDVAGAAIGALQTCGPELALAPIAKAERDLHNPAHAQPRLNLVYVLQGFLQKEPSPQYYPRIIDTTIQFLSSFDNVTTHQDVRRLLHEQIQKSKQDAKIVTESLLKAIAPANEQQEDEQQAKRIQDLLQDNCLAVLSYIIGYWNTHKLSDLARARIIEVLGKVRDRPEVADKPIVNFLLQQVDAREEIVQQALCHALTLHQPASVRPLVLLLFARNASANAQTLAANTLKEIGASTIVPICQELANIQSHTDTPEPGLRLLVYLLDYFRQNALLAGNTNEGVVRTLLVLLKWLTDNVRYVPLAAYVIQALVGFRHPLVISPLIQLLGRSETTLDKVYEEAIKGLSSLGDIDTVFNSFINALNSPQETVTTRRMRQVLLGIKPFPYDRLLFQFKDSRGAVVGQVRQVFLENQQAPQTASFLVNHLLDEKAISDNVKQTLKAMQPAIAMPQLVKALGRTGWQDVLEPLLLDCSEPTTVISLLVNELANAQQRMPAGYVLLKILFKYGPSYLPWILPGLENTDARAYTKRLIVFIVDTYRQHNVDLLPDIVSLFEPAATQPEASKALRELLTQELAHLSRDALIAGLGKHQLIEGCILSLVMLVELQDRKGETSRRDETLQAILEALHEKHQRSGAHRILVDLGQLAAEPVCDLLSAKDDEINEEARVILAEMGEVALPSIYRLAHDPQRRRDAENIFMRMDGPLAAKGILRFLVSNDIQDWEMAFALLHMRIEQEYLSDNFDMTGAILQMAHEQANTDVHLRVLTMLLFFNNSTQQREQIAEHIANAIKISPKYHAEFMRTLFLLGTQAIEPLAKVVSSDRGRVSAETYLEAVGILGMLDAHPKVIDYVKDLASRAVGLETRDLRLQELRELGFRALGSLLNSPFGLSTLRQLQTDSSRDITSFEFYDVLLGKRNMPEIERLNNHIQQQENTIASLNQQTQQKDTAIAGLNRQIREKNTTISGLNRQIREKNTAIDELRGQLQQAHERINTLQRRISN